MKSDARGALVVAALLGSALLAPPACTGSGPDKSDTSCPRTAILECSCGGSATGKMICNDAGTAYSKCDCTAKCGTLKTTCSKCLDIQTQEGCLNVVNSGNEDECDAENQLLSGFCK